MLRNEILGGLNTKTEPFDIAIVGGGATGLGCALDAAARGHSTVLVERADFASGTSSRSTKLIHGGLRYLRAGDLRLVVDALSERGTLLHNAPDFVTPLPFVIPASGLIEKMFYGVGVKIYSMLAGKRRIAKTHFLSRAETTRHLPTLPQSANHGGVLYWDAQFDDARLAISIARAAASRGATLLNYCRANSLLKDSAGRVCGIGAQDLLGGREFEIRANVVISATGPWADRLRTADDARSTPIIAPSRGSHIVLPERYLPGDAALLVPKTSDGRVVFAVPWSGRVIVGTTDIPMPDLPPEPTVTAAEVEYICKTAEPYLGPIDRGDILSVFSGIRPLVQPAQGGEDTSKVSRDHSILVSESGLVTVAGGKWTTYRKMAEETIDLVAKNAKLKGRPCTTREIALGKVPVEGGVPYSPKLPLSKPQVERAARAEFALTLEDVLARRSRCLLLDAREAARIAPEVAADLAHALGEDEVWRDKQVEGFRQLADRHYVWPPAADA